jgi:hypothetical protein
VKQLGMQAIAAIRPLGVASSAHFIAYLAKRGLLRNEVFQDYILARVLRSQSAHMAPISFDAGASSN